MSPNTLAWLNRIGILLNFFGGFMIAPELIGEARLSRFEQRLRYLLGRWWLSLWLRIETEGDDMDILDGRDDFKWIVGFICMVASIYAVEPLLENPPGAGRLLVH